MTAYESLNRVRRGWMEYERLLSKVEHLQALAERATPVLSGLPKAAAKHGQSDETWAALADYRRECEQKLRDYVAECRRLEEELGFINSSRVRTAMRCRYVDLMSVSEIAEIMAMNERNVYRLLQRGKKLYEKWYESNQ